MKKLGIQGGTVPEVIVNSKKGGLEGGGLPTHGGVGGEIPTQTFAISFGSNGFKK